MNPRSLANFIRMAGEIACLLEVSATPKPGNVHRLRDFKDVRFEDFLAAGVTLGPWLEKLSLQGKNIREKKINWQELSLGKHIKEAIKHSSLFHRKTNTNLGIILLLCPLSVAAGYSGSSIPITNETFLPVLSPAELRTAVQKVLINSTVADAVHVSEGIRLRSPGGLQKVPKYDLNNNHLIEELEKDEITLFELMKECQKRDNICLELGEFYPITFNIGLPTLHKTFESCQDINLAIIQAYLTIMQTYPDTFVARMASHKKAVELGKQAGEILQQGGSLTVNGRRLLEEFDIMLQENDQKINPGTTADLTAASLFTFLLTGGKISI